MTDANSRLFTYMLFLLYINKCIKKLCKLYSYFVYLQHKIIKHSRKILWQINDHLANISDSEQIMFVNPSPTIVIENHHSCNIIIFCNLKTDIKQNGNSTHITYVYIHRI